MNYKYINVFTSYIVPRRSVVRPGEDAGGDEKEGDGETDG